MTTTRRAVGRPAGIELGLARRATVRATAGLGEAAARVELLLGPGERKRLAAIAAGQSYFSRHPGGSVLMWAGQAATRPVGVPWRAPAGQRTSTPGRRA